MSIRTRLTLYFAGLMLALLILVSTVVYFFDEQSQHTMFYSRLQRKAETTAEVYARKNRRLEETDAILLLTQEQQHEAIYDETNTLVYSSGRYAYYPVTAHFLSEIRQNRQVEFSAGNRLGVGVFFERGTDRFVVIVTAEDTFGRERLRALRNNLMLVNLPGLGLVIALAWLFSGRALKPVQHLINEIQQLSTDRLTERLPTGNGQDELAKLSIQFNQLLGRLERTVQQNQAFVTNASHELRTPLTNLLGTLQVSLSYDQRPDRLRATLQSAIEEVQSLISLANNLLLLAELSVEKQAATLTFEPVWPTEPLLDAVQTINRKYPQQPVTIDLPDEEDDRPLRAHADLLTVVLTNLLDNACKYSPTNHPVQVRLRTQSTSVEYVVQDEGIGIPADAIPHLFVSLYRADNARQTHKGNGVGLALVHRIIHLHGGRVQVESIEGKGTTVMVSLPL
ncbi:HAMP domain-containing protein [Fibrella sp. HMF5335]|uniref:histidine kinase n=1 Tax=Fibrella rubiginis TaxID=2817060 RepID=A0A939GFM5_9BACT|nr:ATP-binding protein [Fibrella rubiginis]MBO0936359.1 HAMP domain-containing protein [Fibrella rubiginis]